MGLLDGLVGGIVNSMLKEGENALLPNILNQVLGKTDMGSLGGLLNQLQQGGLGAEVGSWLGNGQNMPLDVNKLKDALGQGQLGQLAQASGLPLDELLKMLAQHLPGAVDAASPNGHLETGDVPMDSQTGNDSGSLADQAGLNNIGR